jgi:hypothetical protein
VGSGPENPIPDGVKAELKRLAADKLRLGREAEQEEQRAAIDARAGAMLDLLVADPLGVYDRIGAGASGRAEQGALLRLLVKDVAIAHDGRHGPVRRFWIENYTSLVNGDKLHNSPVVTST